MGMSATKLLSYSHTFHQQREDQAHLENYLSKKYENPFFLSDAPFFVLFFCGRKRGGRPKKNIFSNDKPQPFFRNRFFFFFYVSFFFVCCPVSAAAKKKSFFFEPHSSSSSSPPFKFSKQTGKFCVSCYIVFDLVIWIKEGGGKS